MISFITLATGRRYSGPLRRRQPGVRRRGGLLAGRRGRSKVDFNVATERRPDAKNDGGRSHLSRDDRTKKINVFFSVN